ncbi:aquaporin-11-like [Physella acuta]|uniref:aquaporin-11-like n=1 Tax=Physella acuta TaxID=109671 RepID=UPI0027DD180C|nr:aquaporin-11-like [Physella acuta]
MFGADWRAIWRISTGHDPEIDFVEPYVASLIFFAINMMAGILLRALSSVFLPPSIRGYALDFITTMEACAYFFENNFVLKYYGSLWFAIAIIIQCFICARTVGDSSENPVKALHQLVAKEISVQTACLKVLVQMVAGLASYRLAQLIWSLDLISDHHERYYETSCESDLHVTLLMGFLLELGASLSDTWFGMQTVSATPLLDELLKYINGATMITLGVTTTGMYFNPAMASGHTVGCHGTALWEHVFVYWAGPFIGCFVALQINKLFHIDVTASETDKAEQKKHK